MQDGDSGLQQHRVHEQAFPVIRRESLRGQQLVQALNLHLSCGNGHFWQLLSTRGAGLHSTYDGPERVPGAAERDSSGTYNFVFLPSHLFPTFQSYRWWAVTMDR